MSAEGFPVHGRDLVGRFVTLHLTHGDDVPVLVVSYSMTADGQMLGLTCRSNLFPQGAHVPWHSVLWVTDIGMPLDNVDQITFRDLRSPRPRAHEWFPR